jgi:hypothetical protein
VGAVVGKNTYLYWSSLEDFEVCPQKYLWGHGHGTIDLGRGPGRSKEKPVKDSKHHAVMGIVIAKAMESIYNDELWRTPITLPTRLTEIVKREFTFTVGESYIDWNRAPQRHEMLQVCLDGTLNYLRTMKAQKLLGPYAKAEVDITTWVDKYTPVAGRPDLIIRRDDSGVTIIDGKNSANPGKYTNPDQLRWYALCFYLAYNVIPNRLAFCYFRYPEGSPPEGHDPAQPWTGLVDVPVTREDLKNLALRAKGTHRAMEKELFEPTPSPKACRFCSYETVCEARQEQKALNPRKPSTPREPADDLTGGASGIVDLGFISASSLSRPRK